LNNIDRNSPNDDPKQGNMIIWKHLSEEYLLKQHHLHNKKKYPNKQKKKVAYTILHTSQILASKNNKHENEVDKNHNKKAQDGLYPVLWDTDDYLLLPSSECQSHIPAEDVAEVILQSLWYDEALSRDRSIDITSDSEPFPINEHDRKQDWTLFWSLPGNCVYASDSANSNDNDNDHKDHEDDSDDDEDSDEEELVVDQYDNDEDDVVCEEGPDEEDGNDDDINRS